MEFYALSSYYFIAGLIAHLFADWIFQNEWIAKHKSNLNHPAAWLHGFIHFGCALFVFEWPIALILATSHMLVDERSLLQLWRKYFGQTTEGPMAIHVQIWSDQVVHWTIIAITSGFVVRTVLSAR